MITPSLKAYNMKLKESRMDSPLTLRSDEIIIKKERFNELCMMESREVLTNQKLKVMEHYFESLTIEQLKSLLPSIYSIAINERITELQCKESTK